MISPALLPKSLALVFIIFTIFTISLTDNIQPAHAVTGFTAETTSTTQITITWDVTNMDTGSITDNDFVVQLDDNTAIFSADFNVAFSDDTGAGGNDQTIITLTANTMPTDDTPRVTLLLNQDVTSGGGAVTLNGVTFAEAVDGVSPVFVSGETTSSTTIALTFSEIVETAGVNLNDFLIGGVVSSPSVDVIGGSGTTILTLTLTSAILSTDSPTFVYTQTGNALEDVDGNDVATTPGDSITNNVAAPAPEQKKGGGGCSGDCENPTLGMTDHGRRLVDNGFSYNDNPIDVEHYFTPYPLVTAKVGVPNVAEFKIYDNSGPDKIHHFEFAFGLGKGESIDQNQAMIIWDKTFDGIVTTELDDPENVLDNVRIDTSEVLCQEDSQQMCLLVQIYHTFRAPLEFNVLGTNVWDAKRNAMQNYYNHGVEVEGDSMNAPLTKEIPGSYKSEGIITVTQTELYSDLWVASDGRIFEIWENGSFRLVNSVVKITDDTGDMRERDHSAFQGWKNRQAELATEIFDSSTLVSFTPESFAYDFPDVDSRTQFLIDNGLIDYIRK